MISGLVPQDLGLVSQDSSFASQDFGLVSQDLGIASQDSWLVSFDVAGLVCMILGEIGRVASESSSIRRKKDIGWIVFSSIAVNSRIICKAQYIVDDCSSAEPSDILSDLLGVYWLSAS